MRRTLIRLGTHAFPAVRVIQSLDEQPAQGTELVKLPALFVDLFIQAVDGIFQTDKFEFYFYKTLFHDAVRLWIQTTLGKRLV